MKPLVKQYDYVLNLSVSATKTPGWLLYLAVSYSLHQQLRIQSK